MGQQLSPEHQELYRRVDEVLHYLWDPIGVSNTPEARNEYYSYLPSVFSLLTNGASTQKIAEYLIGVATNRMGFPDSQAGREHSQKIATVLQRWCEVTDRRDLG